MTYGLSIENVISLIAVIGGVIGGSITIYTYYRNSQLRRTEWLYSLFDKFFFQSRYCEIRRILDYDDPAEFKHLKEVLETHVDVKLEESFVDYLNFFQFIASLHRLRQLRTAEICIMFKYYILLLDKHDFIKEYVKNEGFDELTLLINNIRRR